MNRYVIIVAGGRGLRMGGSLPKQFIPLEGKPVLMHTLETFHRWDATARLVLVLPADQQSYWAMLCREIGCRVPHTVATGGETRFHSVLNGLRMVRSLPGFSESDALVAVHDGVRPFVSPSVIEACFGEAEKRVPLSRPCLWLNRFAKNSTTGAVVPWTAAVSSPYRRRRFSAPPCSAMPTTSPTRRSSPTMLR